MAEKPDIRYGDYDGIASRFTVGPSEAWALHKVDREWIKINSASHGEEVRELTKAEWEKEFPDTPPLPPEAFKPR